MTTYSLRFSLALLFFTSLSFGATRDVLPRASHEGNVGLSTRPWLGVAADEVQGSTIGLVRSIWFVDGSSQTTAAGAGGGDVTYAQWNVMNSTMGNSMRVALTSLTTTQVVFYNFTTTASADIRNLQVWRSSGDLDHSKLSIAISSTQLVFYTFTTSASLDINKIFVAISSAVFEYKSQFTASFSSISALSVATNTLKDNFNNYTSSASRALLVLSTRTLTVTDEGGASGAHVTQFDFVGDVSATQSGSTVTVTVTAGTGFLSVSDWNIMNSTMGTSMAAALLGLTTTQAEIDDLQLDLSTLTVSSFLTVLDWNTHVTTGDSRNNNQDLWLSSSQAEYKGQFSAAFSSISALGTSTQALRTALSLYSSSADLKDAGQFTAAFTSITALGTSTQALRTALSLFSSSSDLKNQSQFDAAFTSITALGTSTQALRTALSLYTSSADIQNAGQFSAAFSSIAALQVSTNAIKDAFNTFASSASRALLVLTTRTLTATDEGGVSGAALTQFNFVGAGVAYTESGATGTVTISGGAGPVPSMSNASTASLNMSNFDVVNIDGVETSSITVKESSVTFRNYTLVFASAPEVSGGRRNLFITQTNAAGAFLVGVTNDASSAGGGDNLGNAIADRALQMSGFGITRSSSLMIGTSDYAHLTIAENSPSRPYIWVGSGTVGNNPMFEMRQGSTTLVSTFTVLGGPIISSGTGKSTLSVGSITFVTPPDGILRYQDGVAGNIILVSSVINNAISSFTVTFPTCTSIELTFITTPSAAGTGGDIFITFNNPSMMPRENLYEMIIVTFSKTSDANKHGTSASSSGACGLMMFGKHSLNGSFSLSTATARIVSLKLWDNGPGWQKGGRWEAVALSSGDVIPSVTSDVPDRSEGSFSIKKQGEGDGISSVQIWFMPINLNSATAASYWNPYSGGNRFKAGSRLTIKGSRY